MWKIGFGLPKMRFSEAKGSCRDAQRYHSSIHPEPPLLRKNQLLFDLLIACVGKSLKLVGLADVHQLRIQTAWNCTLRSSALRTRRQTVREGAGAWCMPAAASWTAFTTWSLAFSRWKSGGFFRCHHFSSPFQEPCTPDSHAGQGNRRWYSWRSD